MSEKPTSFILLVSKGILRDRHMRRTVLFWVIAAALLMVAVGALLLDDWLMHNLLIALLYWGACAWLTLTSVLLAFFDMLVVRGEAARERQRFKRTVLGSEDDASGKPGDRPL